MRMPKVLIAVAAILIALSLVPFALVARARATKSALPRVHPIQDMDNQPKFKLQQVNGLFADSRAMRPAIPGTVARGALRADEHFYAGKVNGEWATTFPEPVTRQVMERGQARFGIFCATCHGLSGYGNGPTSERAIQLGESQWVPAASFHTETVRARPVGHLFNTITNGIRTMPAYASQIPVADRWAIVAYVRALQRSQHATLGDVPPEQRAALQSP
jgi:mono/diheme cytochrome c family protein